MLNNRNRRTLEFDVTDAPMIIGALRIAANTALMCGKPDAQARLKQLRKAIEQYVPPEANWFDEEDWAEMGMALTGAEIVHVFYDVPAWARDGVNTWMREKHLRIIIGSRDWTSKDRFGDRPAGPAEELARVLQEIAPIDCTVSVGKPGEPADPIKAVQDAAHHAHCNQGLYEDSCKYGEENCPMASSVDTTAPTD